MRLLTLAGCLALLLACSAAGAQADRRQYLPLAADEPTATPTATVSPTPGTGSDCAQSLQVIVNGSFESGGIGNADGWGDRLAFRSELYPRTGAWSMLLIGGVELWQEVVVPTWAETVALYYSYVVQTWDDAPKALAITARVDASGDGGGVLLERSHGGDPVEVRLDRREQAAVLGNRGKRALVHFRTDNPRSNYMYWYVDDVRLVFACGAVGPSALAESAAQRSGPRPMIAAEADDG